MGFLHQSHVKSNERRRSGRSPIGADRADALQWRRRSGRPPVHCTKRADGCPEASRRRGRKGTDARGRTKGRAQGQGARARRQCACSSAPPQKEPARRLPSGITYRSLFLDAKVHDVEGPVFQVNLKPPGPDGIPFAKSKGYEFQDSTSAHRPRRSSCFRW
jgi:hypothetical protein